MVDGPTNDVAAIREDSRQAAQVMSELFPLKAERAMALRVLAGAILAAARVAPASWGISLFPKRLCLNVGRGAALQFYPGEIVFIVTEPIFKRLAMRTRRAFRINGRYRFVPDALEGKLSAERLREYESFSHAHVDLIERAAANRKICFWPKAHSPSVVGLLNDLGMRVPAPDYVTVPEQADDGSIDDIDELDRVTIEGRRVLREHLVVERNAQLSRRKREHVLAETGRLECEVCTFDFEQAYGSIGHSFAEVHHLRPLGSSRRTRSVRATDLAVVCSNCHRMLHKGNPVFSLEELRRRRAQSRTPA